MPSKCSSRKCKLQEVVVKETCREVNGKGSDEEEKFFVTEITPHKDRSRCEWIAPLKINGTVTPLKVDSGAQVNILTWSDLQGLKEKPKIRRRCN